MRETNEKKHVDIYVDGVRHTGLLLSTSGSIGTLSVTTKLPAAAAIVVGFRVAPEPVFLVGNLARARPETGSVVHLFWLRAETRASPERLRSFLGGVFGITNADIVVVGQEGHGTPRAQYRFTAPEDERTQEDTTPPEQDADEAPRERRQVEKPAPPEDAGGRGALTTLISRGGLRAPTSLPAEARIEGSLQRGRVLFLSTTGLFLQVGAPGEVPARTRSAVPIRFLVPDGEGRNVTTRALCRVLGVDDGVRTGTPGLDLEFARFDDGADGAVRRSYVRSLHLNGLARD